MKKILLFLFSLTLFFSLTLKEGNAVWMYPTDPLNPPAGDMTIEGKLTIDDSDTECLLVRKDADGGDIFTVDCTNMFIYLGASAGSGDAVKIGSTIIDWKSGKIITNTTPTSTMPIYTTKFGGTADNDTGRGSAGADIISDIAGGVEAQRLAEASRTIETNTTVGEDDGGDLRMVTTAAHVLIVADVVQFAAGTGSLPTGISASTNYYVTQVDDANKFNLSTSRGGSNVSYTDTGTAFTSYELEITINQYGYVAIGQSAPRVRIVKLTGTSPAVGASGTIAHGLADRTKILSAQVLIAGNNGNPIPPNFTSVGGYEFEFFIDPTDINIYCIAANSANIDGNAVTVLITYEE